MQKSLCDSVNTQLEQLSYPQEHQSYSNAELRLDVEKLTVNDYDPIAPVFNEVMGDDFIDAIQDFRVEEMIRLLSKKDHCRVLDLCCGTGLFLSRIVSHRVEGIGIDRSSRQLEFASPLMQTHPRPVRLIKGDIRNTQFPERCDLITMNLDSLNHILRWAEWKDIFSRIVAVLNKGGLFAFDVSSKRRSLISKLDYHCNQWMGLSHDKHQ